jgi:hypothetical protein
VRVSWRCCRSVYPYTSTGDRFGKRFSSVVSMLQQANSSSQQAVSSKRTRDLPTGRVAVCNNCSCTRKRSLSTGFKACSHDHPGFRRSHNPSCLDVPFQKELSPPSVASIYYYCTAPATYHRHTFSFPACLPHQACSFCSSCPSLLHRRSVRA